MHWRTSQVLAQKLAALRDEQSANGRGKLLELFIADLFGQEHFRVDRENLSSNGRQVDLFLQRGQLRLLVETKSTKRAATIEEIDQLLTRLQAAPPDVVGLFVSLSGFSTSAIRRVELNIQRPILLITGEELDALLERGHGLHALITWKLDHLTRHQQVKFGSEPSSSPLWLSELPEAGIQIFTPSGAEVGCWVSDGGFHGVVHSLGLSDVDWGVGKIAIDFELGLEDASDLVDLLKRLAQTGWITHDGSWRIEQSNASWSGFAAAELDRQITDWTNRYRGRAMHHTEQVSYCDYFEDGLFTLAADVDTSQRRWVRRCSLSFVLRGIPLDTSPYEALITALPVLNNPTFVGMDSGLHVSGRIGRRRSKPAPQRPLAHLVRHRTMFGDNLDGAPSWVEGVVLPDPMDNAPTSRRIDCGLPAESLGSALCWLPQHHHQTDSLLYETLHVSSLHTTDVQVIRIRSNWLDPEATA